MNQLSNAIKTTKSQNIKKKKKNPNAEIKVVYNGPQNNQNEEQINSLNNQNNADFEEDEPTLPVFKHKSKSKGKRDDKIFDSESDGFEQESKNRVGKLSSRKS